MLTNPNDLTTFDRTIAVRNRLDLDDPNLSSLPIQSFPWKRHERHTEYSTPFMGAIKTDALNGMFARITFYPTLLYNVFMEKVTKRQWYNRIDEHVILGALPLKGMAETLMKEENIKGVVSMNENYELALFAHDQKSWESLGIKFLQLKTRDIFESPDQNKLQKGVQFIHDIIKDTQGSVYVHCKAGRTRSATLVGCYLISKNRHITPSEAIAIMKSKRPHIWLHKKQIDAMQLFYNTRIKECPS